MWHQYFWHWTTPGVWRSVLLALDHSSKRVAPVLLPLDHFWCVAVSTSGTGPLLACGGQYFWHWTTPGVWHQYFCHWTTPGVWQSVLLALDHSWRVAVSTSATGPLLACGGQYFWHWTTPGVWRSVLLALDHSWRVAVSTSGTGPLLACGTTSSGTGPLLACGTTSSGTGPLLTYGTSTSGTGPLLACGTST